MMATPTYRITEDQLRAIMRLADAANLIAAALPGAYTATPLGSLADLQRDVAEIALSLRMMSPPEDIVNG